MNGPFASNAFGAGGLGAGMWEAVEQLRSQFEQRTASPRMSRGDVRAAVLALLVEQPMHGYQIIHEIEERSGGAWKPSAGSVYPTLQLLADEGMLSTEESNGRKTYSLTEAGRAVAVDLADRPAPWQNIGARSEGSGIGALTKAGVELAQASAQVARTGTPDQVREAGEILDEARRRLYALLAQG